MQRLVAHHARASRGVAKFGKQRFQLPRRRVPVQMHDAFALAPADQQLEPLHLHGEIQRLHPFDDDAQRVFVAEVVELGLVFAPDRLDPLLLTPPPVIGRRQCCEPTPGLALQLVVIVVQPLLVARQAPAQAAGERLQQHRDPGRQRRADYLE
jgi:hypothetical protein